MKIQACKQKQTFAHTRNIRPYANVNPNLTLILNLNLTRAKYLIIIFILTLQPTIQQKNEGDSKNKEDVNANQITKKVQNLKNYKKTEQDKASIIFALHLKDYRLMTITMMFINVDNYLTEYNLLDQHYSATVVSSSGSITQFNNFDEPCW